METGSVGYICTAAAHPPRSAPNGTGLTVNAVTGLTASNLDTTVSSRMATYTQPTGFLAATFPSGTIANTTNITAGTITTTTNLTNLPSIPANWITASGITNGALNGKGDQSLRGRDLVDRFLRNPPIGREFTTIERHQRGAANPGIEKGLDSFGMEATCSPAI